MWFCAGWLLIGHYAPPRDGLLGKPVLELLNLFGTGGKLAAISVLCLLVGEVTGSLIQGWCFRLSAAYLRRLGPDALDRLPRGPLSAFQPMSSRSITRLRGRILEDYRRHQEETTSDATPRTVDRLEVDRLAAAALSEILFMSPRLIVAKPELYAEFNRIKGESEFRDAILLPLPLLAIAVSVNLAAPGWLVSLVLVGTVLVDVSLFRQARGQFREAHSLVGHSVADGTIESAAMSDRTRPR